VVSKKEEVTTNPEHMDSDTDPDMTSPPDKVAGTVKKLTFSTLVGRVVKARPTSSLKITVITMY